MFGIETSYCNAMIDALVEANHALMEMTVDEAVEISYVRYKGDTLGIDQIPENTIAGVLTEFDQFAVLITEERGEEANPLAHESALSVRGPKTFFVCDPCDRSNQFQEYLKKGRKHKIRVADVLRKSTAKRNWESSYKTPSAITGPNAAITCVRRGLPICSVLLNYLTQEITVACSAGIYHTAIEGCLPAVSRLTLENIKKHGERMVFPNVVRERNRHFTTFVGKPERGYPQNLAMTKLAREDDLARHLYYDQPGGPTRILYLSCQQPQSDALGFIVANGEKIGEWIHWLTFIRFANRNDDRGAKALRLFEITQEESTLRDRYLMTPTEPYSAFKEMPNGQVVVNVDRLGEFDNPSKYRATLLVTSAINDWAIRRAHQYGYRELVFYGD